MANETITELLEHFALLLEIKNENPFKIKAFQNTARLLDEQTKDVSELVASGAITNIPGIGKGSQTLLTEFVKTGKVAEFETLKAEFPETIFELLQVRGLGPKKIKALYESLQLASLSELEYACQENRLLELKGFGEKTQANILKSIGDIKANAGRVLLPVAEHEANELLGQISAWPGVKKAVLVGQVRRSLETISSYSFLLLADKNKTVGVERLLPETSERGLPLEFTVTESDAEFADLDVRLSGSEEFVQSLPAEASKLAWIPAEFREHAVSAIETRAKNLVTEKDIRGVFHMHTKASDGANTLEEMLLAARALGFEYIGVSDHSATAVYAHGLREDAIKKQRDEIEKLRKKYSDIYIFHGIESDILADGSLDYPEAILAGFDFVIASVHGQMQMNKADMTKRLCKVLANPYTTWLGHMTGRLLLGRAGYDFDLEKVLEAAEKHGKGIELNANPYRLDIDWRLLPELQKRKINVGIFPDAHSTHGLEDFRYGVTMARKGGLSASDVINTKTLTEMKTWLAKN